MRKGFATFIFALLTGADAFASVTTPAYKLGNAYASETTSGKKCLEGHSGAMLGNADCTDFAQGCKSNAECSSKFGTGYVCAKGGAADGGKRRGVCRYQECSGAGDTSCSTKYSHLRSCVKNSIGVYECRVTCNWQKIKEAGKAVINSMNVADRMKFEYALWKSPTNTNLLANNQAYLTEQTTTIYDYWYTCKNGKIASCDEFDIEDVISEASWDDGKGGGYKYQPCLPCSIATGGTYGVQADEDISKAGTYAWSLTVRNNKANWYLDLTDIYVNTGGGFWTKQFSKRCGNKSSYTVAHARIKLANSIPFTTRVNSGEKAKVERVGLRNSVELGISDVCMFWKNTAYPAGSLGKGFCPSTPAVRGEERWLECLKSTDLQQLVWVPKQNVTIRMPTSSTPSKATDLRYFNFNQPYGTLLCCRLADTQNRDVDAANKILRSCVAINPAN